MNIGVRVLDLWLDNSFAKGFGPYLPKLVFRPQTTNVTVLEYEKFFISSSIKF